MIKISLGRTGAVATVLASAALALAGCGSSSSNSSTSGSAPSASGSGGTPASAQSADSSKAAQFSQCMRAHGVPDFPDPDASGKFSLRVTKGSDLDPGSAAFKSAEQSCKSLEPPGFGSGSQSVGSQNQMLQFVSCMRSHGVPNFPDPSSSGALKITSSSGVDPSSPQFKSAQQACQKLLPGGGTGASASAGS